MECNAALWHKRNVLTTKITPSHSPTLRYKLDMGNPKDPKWSKVTPTGNSRPPARWRHTATAWGQQVRSYVF